MEILKRLLTKLINIFNFLISSSPYELVRKKKNQEVYLYKYKNYEEYKNIQIKHNIKKLDNVWADENVLSEVDQVLLNNFQQKKLIRGLCHGSRNGFEQEFFNKKSSRFKVIGTDISETALNFNNSYVWDFHDKNTDWVNNFDFIYTNSLDQSWKPADALEVWLEQLNEEGILFIEHTEAHGPLGTSEMDPFGVKPSVFPYVLIGWFGDQISINYTIIEKKNTRKKAWLYQVKKVSKKVKLKDVVN